VGDETPPIRCGERVGEAGTVSVAHKEAKHVLCDFYRRGLKEEPRRLREEGEARSRRREAKVARADWRANSIVKKVRETIEAR